MPLAKLVRYQRRGFVYIAHDHRHKERFVVGHQMRTIHGELPFETEIAFLACLRVGRDDRHKQRTFFDLFTNGSIPRVPTAQFTLIEPDF